MEGLITQHSAIMDKYDPEKKVALVVDEWGAWYAQLPGTTPGFLAQQNSLRDALSPRSTSTSSRATPTACAWPTSRR